ncbi:hypothetical protein TrVE_jg14486 [Triparma verrucosa]|uniref:Uncharacterized protein n=2 Tax=Triparma TaxID=722752 RepID=A0A9W7F0N3_9STRA|nr:hypothetical protein TrVE_jg14486 [Triparma verrucosa]GMH97610.1 hypothetical protein TrST_g10669 [Triparma strigata]
MGCFASVPYQHPHSFHWSMAKPGDLVCLHSLSGKAYMNYLVGQIVAMPSAQTNNRYLIDIKHDRYNSILNNFDSTLKEQIINSNLALREKNLSFKWPLETGDRVRTHSLSTSEMNNKMGSIIQIQADRCAVQVDESSRLASFKQNNLLATYQLDAPVATATAVPTGAPVGSAFDANDDDEIFISVATPV